MLKPVKMVKVSVVGPKEYLATTSETLHRVHAVHIEDPAEEEYFKIGEPLEKASTVSRYLVLLRSYISHLKIDPDKVIPRRKYRASEIEAEIQNKLDYFQQEIGERIEKLRQLADRVKALDEELLAIEPLKALGIPPRLLKGYKSIRSFVGIVKEDPTEKIREVTSDFEVIIKPYGKEFIVAVFVRTEQGDDVFRVLQECGYKEVSVPDIEDYEARIKEIEAEKASIADEKKRIEAELEEIKRREVEYMLAMEEYLSIELDKAELPLRALVSKYAFMIVGYVPAKQYEKVKAEIESATNGRVIVELVEGEEEESEPPTLLANPAYVKDFEVLSTTYAIPKYNEIDPTAIMAVFFPLFFGMMLGDVGYGGLIALLALFLKTKFKTEGWQKLLNVALYSGIVSIFFGFIYGEIFGPLYVPGVGYSAHFLGGWAESVHFHPIFDRVEEMGVKVLLFLVLVVGMFKILWGFAMGFYNVYNEHGFVEAVLEKGCWFLGVLALALAILGFCYNLGVFADLYEFTLHHYGVGIGLPEHPPEDIPPLPIPGLVDGWQAGVNIYYMAALPLVIVWFILFLKAEIPKMGPFGIIMGVELLTWFGQIISYARLLAIGLSSVYIAFVINYLGLKIALPPGMALLPLALVIMLLGHFVNLILGILDPGLQSLRLHYVEFFTKFFEGGGRLFKPFGRRKRFIEDE
ncbi:V-type ATP synthase subunit I [Archaeoglobus veneficus]|uniref:A-type ATP synthase subunit I n=1 Tax=Archaeoglobus veneficus (strain DSM 11195 / SNP6) TaxID=693661 RepID=F2KP23_ARCVS|nr:V-type ATP synthase subunit I [Archaeoglobus veneficus]AEA46331.1 V-type ATPase 116 kDa subunit [Archaeoglobus veneficus SNP6]